MGVGPVWSFAHLIPSTPPLPPKTQNEQRGSDTWANRVAGKLWLQDVTGPLGRTPFAGEALPPRGVSPWRQGCCKKIYTIDTQMGLSPLPEGAFMGALIGRRIAHEKSKHKGNFFGNKTRRFRGGEGANHVYLLGRATITFWRRLFCFGKSEEWGCFVWLVGCVFCLGGINFGCVR
jgi:hypothetical protein